MTAQLSATEAEATAAKTMKALVQEGSGSADVLRVREIQRPELLDDRVLIRVRAASVNALDWHSVHGGLVLEIASKVMRSQEQPVRGVDVAGVIESVGKNVTGLKPGDEVFGGSAATFAQYARARVDRIALKPSNLTFEQAATIGVAGHTALQGLRDIAQLTRGQRVLVHGAGGGVGTFAVQIGKALGLHVTAVTGPRNVDIVRSLGADQVIDYSREDFTKRSDRFDAVFDVAATRSIGDLRRVLVPGGVLVLCGADKRGGIWIFARIIAATVRARLFGQRVKFYVAKNRLEDLLLLRQWVEEGRLRPVVERTYPLEQAAEAIRYVGSGQARAKVVITM